MSALRALSRSPHYVAVGPTSFGIPYRCAAEWLIAIGHNRAGTILVDLSLPETRKRMLDGLVHETFTAKELATASFGLIEKVSGRPKWWEAVRLGASSDDQKFLGSLLLRGLDPWQRSFGEWCAASYTLIAENLKPLEEERFRMQLMIPPPGYEDEWDDDPGEWDKMIASARAMPGRS